MSQLIKAQRTIYDLENERDHLQGLMNNLIKSNDELESRMSGYMRAGLVSLASLHSLGK